MFKKPIDILAIGDITTDAFIRLKDASVHCQIDQHNCQICLPFGDKIPFEYVKVVKAVGNAANAAVAASRLGLRSALVANVGDDQNGKDNFAELQRNNVITKLDELQKFLQDSSRDTIDICNNIERYVKYMSNIIREEDIYFLKRSNMEILERLKDLQTDLYRPQFGQDGRDDVQQDAPQDSQHDDQQYAPPNGPINQPSFRQNAKVESPVVPNASLIISNDNASTGVGISHNGFNSHVIRRP